MLRIDFDPDENRLVFLKEAEGMPAQNRYSIFARPVGDFEVPASAGSRVLPSDGASPRPGTRREDLCSPQPRDDEFRPEIASAALASGAFALRRTRIPAKSCRHTVSGTSNRVRYPRLPSRSRLSASSSAITLSASGSNRSIRPSR